MPTTPVFDVWSYLAANAARTTTIQFGTYVNQLTLRHPRLAARSITTMDVISGGRVEAGVGAGYVRAEWDALGIDRRSSRHGLSHAMPSTDQRLRKTRRVVRHVRMTNGSHEDVASPGDGTDDAGLEAENRAVCATKSKESVLA